MLTDSVAISLVGAAATVIVSIINAAFAYISNQRGKRNEDHLVETKAAVETLKVQTNGISEKLLQVTGDAERAKGVLTGHAEAKADADALKCQYQASDSSCKYPASGDKE